VVLRLFWFVFNKLTWQKLRCIWCLHKIMNCVCSFLCKVLKDSMLTLVRVALWFAGTVLSLWQHTWAVLNSARVCPLPTCGHLYFLHQEGWNTCLAAFRETRVIFSFGGAASWIFLCSWRVAVCSECRVVTHPPVLLRSTGTLCHPLCGGRGVGLCSNRRAESWKAEGAMGLVFQTKYLDKSSFY